jgi:hypothetical protein
MATNVLRLNIPDIMTDCILRIEDTSVYSDVMPYSCPTVQIMSPGFNNWITFDDTTPIKIEKNFILNLTACDLQLQMDLCGEQLNPLSDGVYTIKYSNSPNDRLFIENYHLRVTKLRNQLKQAWCDLKLSACEPIPEVKAKFNDLMTITGYIDAAKAKVEYCLNIEEGMVLYNYAKKLLDNFSCKLY